ncbi:MAG: hypothetical protein ACRBF0_04170 [Calditrichia bacterium]
MDYTVVTYLAYLLISVGLTIWVARILSRSGQEFLTTVFAGNSSLAHSINQLLVIAFTLLNLGYILLNLKITAEISSIREAIEVLAAQVGLVLMVIGFLHVLNFYLFNRIRSNMSQDSSKAAPPMNSQTVHYRQGAA